MNGLAELRQESGWLLAFGILSIIWGILAILYSVFFTLVTVFAVATLLIVGGGIEAIQVIRHHDAGHWLLYVLEAVLAIVVGALLFRSPEAGALVITLLLAAYFVVAGIFRIVASTALHTRGWGWTMLSGIITLLLGILVWGGWPETSLWVLGLFVGIDLLFSGWQRVMLAMALRSQHFGPAVPV